MDILKGDIFYIAKSNYNNVGSEQNPGRPAVVVSNNEANRFSRNVSVVYLTTQEKKPLPTHCEVVAREKSTALCEGVTTIAKERLLDFVKACTKEEMESIDECLAIALSIGKTPDPTATVENGLLDDLKMKLEDAERALDEVNKKYLEEKHIFEKHINELVCRLKVEIAEKEFLQSTLDIIGDPTEEAIKLETERDLYKAQYEQLLERMLTK